MPHYRSAALRAAVAVLILFASVCAFVSASSLPTAGHTGQALALKAALSPATKARMNALLADARWPHFANGRYKADPRAFGARRLHPMAGSNPQPILINEGVQTFDLFAPPPSFAPSAGPLLPTNLTPVWTADENFVLYSSNRDANGNVASDGNFHIWAVPAKGGAAIQITTGPGSEFYPALNRTNTVLAFTSNANSTTGNQDLYLIGGQTGVSFNIGQAPIDPSAAAVSQNTASSLTLGDNNIFTSVTRPALSPAGDRVVFSATTTSNAGGHTPGVRHLYYLNVATRGYDPTQSTPPAQLTDGPETDTNPAWSPKGDFIAFDSNSSGFTNTNTPLGPNGSPVTSTATGGTRGLFLLNGGTTTGVGAVPSSLTGVGGRVDAAGSDDFAPAWSADNSNQYTNPNADLEYIAFGRGTSSATAHDIYYFLLTTNNTNGTITISPETAGAANAGIKVNTDDNAGETSPNGNVYDDVYPTWSPFLSVFSIAYQSPRSVTFNTPQNLPLEVAQSLAEGTTTYGPNNVGANYTGLLESQLLNLDPPTLLRYDGTEVVRVTDENGVQPSGRFIQPGRTVTFTVRLSNREAGINNTGDPNGGPNVYLQIKDPDSKYQDSQNIEHKVFARSNENPSPDNGVPGSLFGYPPTFSSLLQGTNSFNYRHDTGSAALLLFDGGDSVFTYAPDDRFGSFNIINGGPVYQFGAVGGTDGSDTIGVGHSTIRGSTAPSAFFPAGPEYECQYVNPTAANPGTALGDYGTPYYLAGYDDQVAFSGSTNPPRPLTNTAATQTTAATFAEWKQLSLVPAAQQDGLGGVLYTATYTTPTASSDFYVDVIAYDRAAFPALTSSEISGQYLGQSKNWRIYDNVGGFTTTTFDGSNDILVVSDNALGQKFAATTFGGQNGNSNLQPTFYGAESYYTDVDEALLPNATDLQSTLTAPTAPPIPAQQNTPFPTNVTATPANAAVIVEWSGDNQPTYNIYRSTVVNGAFPAQYTRVGTVTFNPPTGVVATTFNDNTVTNGTTYYYVVTSVSSTGNESQPSQPVAQATPLAFGGIVHSVTAFPQTGFFTFPNVMNGLGVGSYVDAINDDGGRVSVLSTDPVTGASTDALLPDGLTDVPYVRSQRYSLWRILSRGPVSSAALAGYQPTFQAQPGVTDPTNNVTAPAADGGAGNAPLVPVAQRCVIWVAPYSGNLPLVDSGSIENPTTQQTLQSYLQKGGRLCLTGANVASALSLKGQGNPGIAGTGAAFLSTYLGAKFASQAGGSQILGSAGTRLSGYSGFNGTGFYNGNVSDVFPRVNPNLTITRNVPPSQQGSLLLGNDLDGVPNWRTDASLDQLGPNIDLSLNSGQGGRNTVQAVAQINTITPNAGVTQDMTTNGAAGLIYHEDYTDPLNSGYGSRVVFGSFGLEGVSIDYYKPMAGFYFPRNQRPNILHNIVSYLRTGTFTVHITQASGQGLAGATVYLRPNGGTLPGPRQLFSASDPNGINSSGNYTINGVEPGTYIVTAYKSGFTTTISNSPFTVEGDTTNSTGLVLAPVPPGRIQGTVKDNGGNPIAGATVTFKSTDGQTNYTVTTGADGTYRIDPASVSSYTGTASKLPQFITATAPTQGNPVNVPSGGTAQADFVLQAQPAKVSGVVFNDINGDGVFIPGNGIAGATVTFVAQAKGVTAPAPVTTASDGSYTVTGLVPGTYTIAVTAPGFLPNSSRSATVQAGDVLTGQNIPLVAAPPTLPGTLGGLVGDAYTGKPLTGVTVTITDAATGKAVTGSPFTTGAATSPGAPAGDGQPLNYGPISLPPGKYNVTVALAGFGSQSVSNQTVLSSTFTRVDFTSASGNPLQPIHVFPAGFNFFSVPYDYAAAGIGIDQIFGTLNTGTRAAPSAGSNRSHIFVWSPQLLQYLLDPTPPADGLHLGQGYWVYLNGPSEVTQTGNLPTTVTIPVGLHRGWNQIGVPSLTPVSIARLSFANASGGTALTFAQATTASYHIVSGTLYGYNGSAYVTLTGTGSLQPWQAYWIYAFADSTLLIPTGGG